MRTLLTGCRAPTTADAAIPELGYIFYASVFLICSILLKLKLCLIRLQQVYETVIDFYFIINLHTYYEPYKGC